MTALYPLRFEPIFRRYLWGGRRLAMHLNKLLGPGDDYAESWEVCDRGSDQSLVANGPLAGKSLGALVRSRGPELLGNHHPQARFPLLFKFLDAQAQLSLQVHPDDAQGARLTPPDLGKTEAWVILEAEPGSYLYAGLKRGFDRQALERELRRGTCELCAERHEPKVGECYFLPAGVIHALGPGLVVAEIQQSSDTTYRLFDWNRVGPDGKPRALHIDQALAAIDYDYGPVNPQKPVPTTIPHAERLVSCDKFLLDRWQLDVAQPAAGDHQCHILVLIEGQIEIEGDPSGLPLERGQVIMLPASLGPVLLKPRGSAVVLDCSLPPVAPIVPIA